MLSGTSAALPGSMWLTWRRLTESFRREGTLGGLYSNLLLTAGSALRSDQAAQGFSWSVFKDLRGWRLHNRAGQPATLLGCPRGEQVSPYIMSGPLFFSVMPAASCPPTTVKSLFSG